MSTLSLEDRFWSKVEVLDDDECWPWQATLINSGYGRFYYNGGYILAHRMAWILAFGEIPEADEDGVRVEIDHACHDPSTCEGGIACPHRRCVNPNHLRVVTHRVNVLRGNTLPALNASKTHCQNGHEFTPENTRFTVDAGRRCRTCDRERRRKGAQIRVRIR